MLDGELSKESGLSRDTDDLLCYDNKNYNNIISMLELAQICWVVKHIHAVVNFNYQRNEYPIARMAFFDSYETIGLLPKLWNLHPKAGALLNK